MREETGSSVTNFFLSDMTEGAWKAWKKQWPSLKGPRCSQEVLALRQAPLKGLVPQAGAEPVRGRHCAHSGLRLGAEAGGNL